jgi:hypothetical protein
MKWRMLLALLSGLLLVLPLAWLSFTVLFGSGTNTSTPQGKTLVPMLSPEERQRLLTYERDCETDADCEPPLRCFFSTRSMSRYCTDSRCVTDLQCKEGFVCRTQTTTRGEAPLRVCSLVGSRKEGEECLEHASSADYACEKDLLCQGRCGRPCQMEEPSSCPEGFFCHGGTDGPSCLPTCEGRTCPEGQRCVVLDRPRLQDRHVSLCARMYGQDSGQNPCPQGQRCVQRDYPEHPGSVWMECISPCGGGAPPCPEGTVCAMSQCLESCTPEDPSTCTPGFVCHRKTDQEPWRCVPTPRASSKPSP